MSYHALSNDSGQTPDQRTAEAKQLLGLIADYEDRLTESEKKFFAETGERFDEFGMSTMISVKQLFWLRDIWQKFA